MNNSLLNVSLPSGDHLGDQRSDSESESEASNYIDYLDNFNRNFDPLAKLRAEKSHSQSLLRNEGTFGESELIFDDDSSPDPPSVHSENPILPEGLSFMNESRRENSILNKNLSMVNMDVIPEEPDASLVFNKNFLSLLNDDKQLNLQECDSNSESEELPVRDKWKRFMKQVLTNTRTIAVKKGVQKPNIKMIIQRSSQPEEVLEINASGLIGSAKDTGTHDVLVGRMAVFENSHPNDVVLRHERSVSRIHFRLITRYYFRNKTQSFERFLCLCLCLNKLRPTFSKFLFLKLLQFICKGPVLLLQDLDSAFGTYVKIQPNREIQLTPNMQFKLGDEAIFKVIHLQPFVNAINHRKIHQQLNFPNTSFIGFGSASDEIPAITDTASLLVLQTINCPSNIAKFLVFNPILDYQYLFGRSDKSDVRLNLSSVSRKQAVVIYEEQGWVLSDGHCGSQSKNGSWRRLSSDNNSSSPKFPVRSGDSFLIGNTVIQLQFDHN